MRFEMVKLDKISFKNPLNDRSKSQIMDSTFFIEITASIKKIGLLEPIGLEDTGNDTYELSFGKHRYLAFLSLYEIEGDKYGSIPAIITDDEDEKRMGVPRAIKILHENRFRKNIGIETYIESSLCLLPKFIDNNNEYSLKDGVDFITKYFQLKEDPQKSNASFKETVHFISSVEKFLEFVKQDISNFKKYAILSGLDPIYKKLYFQQKIFYASISELQQLSTHSIEDFKKCIEDIENSSSKEDAKSIIKRYLNMFSLHDSYKMQKEALHFLGNRIRSIKRGINNNKDFSEEDVIKIKELTLEIENVFKNKISRKKGK